MDNLTHTLTALVLSRAGARHVAPYATPALVVAANAADLDYLFTFGNPARYLEYRYGASHSLAGAFVLGAAVALLFWGFARRRPRGHLLTRLLPVSLLGTFSHLVMDWSTSEGIRWWWPQSQTRYSLDWFPFFDPWLMLILLLGLAVPALLRLVSEEIGAPRSDAGIRQGAWLALLACVLFAGGRAQLHADAVTRLEAQRYQQQPAIRMGAFPSPLNPFRWHGVAETKSAFAGVTITLLGPDGRKEAAAIYNKPDPSPALEAALATRSAELFIEWARFPHAQVSPFGEGWRVELRDLRYAAPGRSHPATVRIHLNSQLEVSREEIFLGQSGS